MGRRQVHPFEAGEFRLVRGFSHVGPQDAAALDQRIGCQLDALAVAALDRLGRDFDTLSGDVVFPAMIGAAQPVLLVAAEPERDAAMGAELVDQAVAPLRVAERQKPLGEKLDTDRRAFILGKLLRKQRRNPVAAEQRAARGAGSGLRQQVVLLASQHAQSYPMADVSRIALDQLESPDRSAGTA